MTEQRADSLGNPTRKKLTILMYHGVPEFGLDGFVDRRTFERHIAYLNRCCAFIHPGELAQWRPGRFGRRRILLTFDDGLLSHAKNVVPVLRRFQVPGLFFVSSRHLDGGGLLWFRYLELLEYFFPDGKLKLHGEIYSMRPDEKRNSLRRLREYLLSLRPHPSELYRVIDEDLPAAQEFAPPEAIADHAAGMTREQLRELTNDPLFSVGAHTIDHPDLTLCTPGEARRQLKENRYLLEQVTGQPCDTVGYPLGMYNESVLKTCEELGFRSGFGVFKNTFGEKWAHLTLERIGIYRKSTGALVAKALVGKRMRAIGVRFG